jgi:very-short-patch-repair endonuclease
MVEVARDLRRDSTPGEDVLWRALRGRALAGRKFRRQQPIGAFVLDFFCAAERLAVEVDGSVHDDPEQAELDAERQTIIESLGVRFVRLSDSFVRGNVDAAVAIIAASFNESPGTTTPSPSMGEGRPQAGVREPSRSGDQP